MPSGTWGLTSIVSSAPTKGYNFAYTFNNIPIPSRWKEADMDVIAFVSYYSADAKQRKVLNTNSKLLLDASPTSIESHSALSPAFALYPNPAKDRINLRANLPDGGRGTLILSDRIGRIVLRTTVTQGINSLSVSSLPAGVYYYRISTPSGSDAGTFTIMKP